MTDHGSRPADGLFQRDDVAIAARKSSKRGFFSIPPPMKLVFDKFPLVTYDTNDLPIRAPKRQDEHVLYVFATQSDARKDRPSFNPACLKWQTYLKFSGISFSTVSSTNHASPSGALPFLIPANQDVNVWSTQAPIPSNRLKRWISSQPEGKRMVETTDPSYEAYASLLDNGVRKAWLYQLYLHPANVQTTRRLYVNPCSSNAVIQATISGSLYHAAEAEIVKGSISSAVIENDIMREAQEALRALSSLLGENDWFFGQQNPGVLDASVFAYTYLILDETFGWHENVLLEFLGVYQNLVDHQKRIANMYYS